MDKVKLKEICRLINGRAYKQDELLTEGKYPVLRVGNFFSDKEFYYSDLELEEDKYCDNGDLLFAWSASFGPKIWDGGKVIYHYHIWKMELSSRVQKQYLYYYLYHLSERIKSEGHGGIMIHTTKAEMEEREFFLPAIVEQQEKAQNLLKIENIINQRKSELAKLDTLIKSRFVELFGDLKSNNRRWRIVGFKECADIDTNMIHDFEGYEDYPHIGIDSIEKETGRLVGYRTIAEDGVISGKYLFSPAHIIYSKIRPNLNKVAMPDFEGLCSADAYPILVKEGICNREYFGYTLRSRYFLDYILAFSNRTNLPKVNKNQVEGFTLPLPPIDIQEQFADFVHQVNKLKFIIKDVKICNCQKTKKYLY